MIRLFWLSKKQDPRSKYFDARQHIWITGALTYTARDIVSMSRNCGRQAVDGHDVPQSRYMLGFSHYDKDMNVLAAGIDATNSWRLYRGRWRI